MMEPHTSDGGVAWSIIRFSDPKSAPSLSPGSEISYGKDTTSEDTTGGM